MLKQGQYAPMPVEQQVMIIYAVTNGFLDDVDGARASASGSAASTSSWPRSSRRSASGIRTEKALSKEIEADLKRAIDEYKKVASGSRRSRLRASSHHSITPEEAWPRAAS